MNSKFLFLFILFSTIISCYSALGQNDNCINAFEAYDTITEYGNFIKYHINNKKARIEYGNESFRNFDTREFDCDIADAWIPRLKYDNKDFMLLHYGCGSPCWGLLLLPLNSKYRIREIMYDLAYDSKTTDLVYTDNENLLIENLSTGKIIKIDLPKCGSAIITYCLDSISIKNSELKYLFYGPEKFDDKAKVRSYKVNF